MECTVPPYNQTEIKNVYGSNANQTAKKNVSYLRTIPKPKKGRRRHNQKEASSYRKGVARRNQAGRCLGLGKKTDGVKDRLGTMAGLKNPHPKGGRDARNKEKGGMHVTGGNGTKTSWRFEITLYR